MYVRTQRVPVNALALAVKQQVDDEGLPGLLLAERVEGRREQSETQGHDLQRLTAHLLVFRIRLVTGVSLQNNTCAFK